MGATLGQLSVHELLNNEKLVVKRLHAARDKKHHQEELNNDEYFALLKEQHETIEGYFGNDFVPNTEFVVVESNMGNHNPELYLPSKEYLMVQEKIKGVEIRDYLHEYANPKILSEDTKNALRLFIERYNEMMSKEQEIIEDQFFIDDQQRKVSIYDTNHPISFCRYVSDNGFLKQFNISESAIQTSQDLLNLFFSKIPELAVLSRKEYQTEIAPVLFMGNCPLYLKIMNILRNRYSDCTEDFVYQGKKIGKTNYVEEGFKNLLVAVDYFPPKGNNIFIRKIVDKFKL